MFMALDVSDAHVEENCVIGPMSFGYREMLAIWGSILILS